jgi:hypothetical protein
MHNNTYTAVGTSVLHGVCKIRFANGAKAREAVLKRAVNGPHTDIRLLECTPMLKLDAAKWAYDQAPFTDADREAERKVIGDFIKKHSA